MKRSLNLVGLFLMALIAVHLGRYYAHADDPEPNNFFCEDTKPRNCYCYTSEPGDGGGPIVSCYATGADSFYTCATQNKSYCDGSASTVVCGKDKDGNKTGTSYTGPCSEKDGPGKDQTKIGDCGYAEFSCKKAP